MRTLIWKTVVSLILLLALVLADQRLRFSRWPSWKLADTLVSLEGRWRPPPPAIRDIVLVGIDSETVLQMKERWPYSRATYASVIRRLKQAGARVIGVDFSFFGESVASAEDARLRRAILKGQPVVLGAALAEDGNVAFSTLPGLPVESLSGLVNKVRDPDGVTRRALTYLMGTAQPADAQRWVFSWELKLLEAGRRVALASLEDHGQWLALNGPDGRWVIPVDPVTKTFPIRFRAHSRDFQRVSFHEVLTGAFDPALVRDKIVLIGLLSEIFQDIHRTPIGWLPGVTLNANVFLALYSQDFLRSVSPLIELAVLGLGVWLATLLVCGLAMRPALLGLAMLLAGFFAASSLLLWWGYTWNYALLPIGVVTIPAAARALIRRGSGNA